MKQTIGELLMFMIVATIVGIIMIALTNADVREFFKLYFERGIPKY